MVKHGYFKRMLVYELVKPLPNSANVEVTLYKPYQVTNSSYRILGIIAYTQNG